ncbi:MAG: restriction endonuclease [Candidatus Hydrogenedentes bacterium]|nr:restriction endonuclease [Candidatus Hydrogenedentota bacterium]
MGLNLANYQLKARKAVREFWSKRESARETQLSRDKVDQGERAGVTAGRNMNGFLNLMAAVAKENGLPRADVHLTGRLVTLPGYFRPTKLWDMLILNDNRLIAAIELKSQVGPSFGNNFNNRAEEALGTAVDLWRAYREGAFGDICRPFVGWLMLVEDCPASRKTVKDNAPHFPVFADFKDASYAMRYEILCRKMMQEQLYTAATVLLAGRKCAKTGAYSELSDMTGLKAMVSQLAAHIAAEAARVQH